MKAIQKEKEKCHQEVHRNVLGMHTKFCLCRSYSQDVFLCMCKDSHCCEVNDFELVSLKKTLVSDVFRKSCGLLMWYTGQRKKNAPVLKGSLYYARMSISHEMSGVKTGYEVPHYRLYGFGLYSFSSYTFVLLEHSRICQQVFCIL